MSKEMKMTVNKLPARTWNWLKMNEASASVAPKPAQEDYGRRLHANEKRAEIRYHLAKEEEQQIYNKIETALGKDMDKLGEEILPAVLECRDSEEIVLDLTPEGNYGRYFLYAKKDQEMNLAVYCHPKAEEDADSPFYLQLKIYAEAGAKVNLAVIQTMNKNTKVFSDIGGLLEENAAVDLVKMELGGSRVYSGAYMDLKGARSSFKAHIGYLGEKEQHLDMNYVVCHHGKKTESLMESNGVLNDNAFKLFRGTIDFIKGCPGSVGNEKEDVLLLGEDVVNQTIPLILCAEEDVEGNHGASIGELDEKTLFYLMSRGFTEESAKKMIARARLDAVAAMIKESSVREKTLKYLEERQ